MPAQARCQDSLSINASYDDSLGLSCFTGMKCGIQNIDCRYSVTGNALQSVRRVWPHAPASLARWRYVLKNCRRRAQAGVRHDGVSRAPATAPLPS